MSEKTEQQIRQERSQEIESWWVSVIPMWVAFAFYIVFILWADLENTDLFIAYGISAGVIGLQSYWVIRGLRKSHGTTVVMGIGAIAVTLGLLWGYISLFH